MSEPDEEAPAKPKFPYLRKGQKKQRTYLRGAPKPFAAPMSSSQSPNPSLSVFQPSTSPFSNLNTGRSTDSGVPHDDVTRPPTGASLPMDRPSSHETRPAVVEEHEDEGNGDEISEEHEQISARREPTFQPDSGASSYLDPVTEPSESALRFRNIGAGYTQYGQKIQTMRSVSMSPSSYTSSELSAPLGASTPIHTQLAPNSFRPLPQHPVETPQARPLSSNRLNVQQNEAQTGISLVQPHRFQQQPRHQLHHRQKENIQSQPISEHVYDQPIQMTPAQRALPTASTMSKRVANNLIIQLRDAIAHADYADEQLRKSAKLLVEKFKEKIKKIDENNEKYREELKEEYEKLKSELEKDFENKVKMIQEDDRAEKERILRDRRDIERDRKMLQKGNGEKDKEMAELRKKLENSETQNAKLRQDVRTKDEKLKKKTEEWEKVTKDYERSKKTCATMEKRIRQMRNEKEKEAREEQMFAQAALNRKTPANKSYLNQTVGAIPVPQLPMTSSRNPSVSNLSNATRTAPPARGRSVSWADEPGNELEVMDELSLSDEGQMHLVEQIKGAMGLCNVYKNVDGEVTKVTTTVENGRMFEFSNGDRRFVNAQESFAWYHHVGDGCIEMDVAHSGIKFIVHLNRQMEIYRPDTNVTLISVNRLEIRTELIYHRDGSHCVEIFDRDGNVLTKNSRGPDMLKKYTSGEKTSFRDRQSRYVAISTFDDFELVEPQFRLRWFEGNAVVVKVFGREKTNEKTLRIEMDPRTGDGQIEAVESRLLNGVARKTLIFKWKGPK